MCSTASSLLAALRRAYPPRTSFVSAKGPSVTVTLPVAALCTRTPVAPKVTPSHSISHPAFMPSTMSLCMDAISASVGRRLVGLYVLTLMKRMSILLGWCFAVTAILSNGEEANRHKKEIPFGANYNRRDLHCLHGTPLLPLYQTE